MAYKLKKKKLELRTKTTGLSAERGKTTWYGFKFAHARNQICQTTLEMDDNFRFHAAVEFIEVWTRI